MNRPNDDDDDDFVPTPTIFPIPESILQNYYFVISAIVPKADAKFRHIVGLLTEPN